MSLTHIDEQGKASMVDVSESPPLCVKRELCARNYAARNPGANSGE